MTPKIKKNIMEPVIVILVLYLVFLGYMYVKQRAFVYFPNTEKPDIASFQSEKFDNIALQTEDNVFLTAAYAPPEDGKPVIVFFHGNAGHIGFREYKAVDFISAGYGFLLAEYRGYGLNKGTPTEQGLYKDGRAYMNWLIEEQNIEVENIILYAESLGTGVATQIALEYPSVQALVLEAPYTTLPAVGQKHMFYLPVNLLAKDRFDNLSKIGKIEMPLLVLHGKRDEIVPFSLGKHLYDAAPEPKKMEVFQTGGHIDLHEFGAHQKVLNFLAGVQ